MSLSRFHLVLGDDTADGGCVGGIERRKAGIAAEDAKNANALMRADGSSLPLDRVAGAGDRRRESDAVLSIADVVVHRLRNTNDLDAEIIELGRIAERVIAADEQSDVRYRAPKGSTAPAWRRPRPWLAPSRETGKSLPARWAGSFWILEGLVRLVCSMVPPRRSIVRVFSRFSCTTYCDRLVGSLKFRCVSASQPRRRPKISMPFSLLR